MRAFGPGEIIEKVVNRHLEPMAVIDALVEASECVPRLSGVPNKGRALPREPPLERIGQRWAEDSGVSKRESFAVVQHRLLRRRPRQERLLRVGQILQGAAPE